MRHNKILGFFAVLALLFPLAVLAQGQGPYRDVRIVVKDLSSDREIGSIQPGGSFTLHEGQRVRLILTALHPGRGQGPAYPETQFTETEPGRGWVRVTRTNVENANATVEIVAPPNPNRNRTETLRYRITENIGIPDALREGSVTIRVEPAPAAGVQPQPVTGDQRARELTNALYRGILMRDLDPSGAEVFIESIARNGHPAVVEAAQRIAQSDESRIRVYERENVCHEQRLLSMYKHLLGMSADQIDRRQWDEYLRRMSQGQIAEVATSMVRSDRFLQAHNLSGDTRFAIRD